MEAVPCKGAWKLSPAKVHQHMECHKVLDYICPNLMGPENGWKGVVFILADLAEQSHQRKPIAESYFPSFTGNPKFCPVV